MADANYPLPGFHFSVDFGGTIINCNEVSGLDMEVEVIEYRAGDDQTFSTQKKNKTEKLSTLQYPHKTNEQQLTMIGLWVVRG